MGDVWLIYNPRSKTTDETVVAEVEQLFVTAGHPINRRFVVGDDELPDRDSPGLANVATILVMSGDGTINTVARNLGDWPGTLVVLPGGTMNLLAGALHGEATASDIVTASFAGSGVVEPVPIIKCGAETAFAGIIVGPSSAWADVREDMRNLDLPALGRDAMQAVEATFNEPRVGIEGSDTNFAAIYLEPRAEGLSGFGVQAENARDLIAHGWAWLRGDFRQGPGQQLEVGSTVVLASEATSFDMLVDGERAEAPNPATFTFALSDVRFFSMRGGVQWS